MRLTPGGADRAPVVIGAELNEQVTREQRFDNVVPFAPHDATTHQLRPKGGVTLLKQIELRPLILAGFALQ